MENLFNILWAVLGLGGIVVALLFRRYAGLGGRRELGRDVLLFAAIVFLLLPVFSMSDDIGYFNYFFSGGQAPNAVFFVSGTRREKQIALIVVLHILALLVAAIVSALRQRLVLGMVTLAEPARVIERRAPATYLRAPPSLL